MSEQLSVIIPAFNEDKNIPYIYQKLKESLKDFEYELIFVDVLLFTRQ